MEDYITLTGKYLVHRQIVAFIHCGLLAIGGVAYGKLHWQFVLIVVIFSTGLTLPADI
jgi:hypothetical protein